MTKWKLALLAALLVVLFYIFAVKFPALDVGRDWRLTYRPAALEMLHGRSPYNVRIFYAAPWSLIPLLPLALLPYEASAVAAFFLGLFAFAYTAYKLGATPASMAIFLTSAAVVGCLLNGNIDWLPLLGLVLPAPLGLILAATKPQVGIGVILYWSFEIYRTKGILETLKIFAPLIALTSLSFWMYGFWIAGFQRTLQQSAESPYHYNLSLWPHGIFVGLWILYKALQTRNAPAAAAASPFLSPYVLQYTWVAALAALIRQPVELAIVSIGLWIPVALRFFP